MKTPLDTNYRFPNIPDFLELQLTYLDKLADNQQRAIAKQVAEYTHEHTAEDGIIPVKPEDILHRQLGFVALSEGQLAGYISARQPTLRYDGFRLTQLGTLCILPEYRRDTYLFRRLIPAITGDLLRDRQLPYAFCNPRNLKRFKLEANYIEAKPSQLPDGASSPYGNQAVIFNGPYHMVKDFHRTRSKHR